MPNAEFLRSAGSSAVALKLHFSPARDFQLGDTAYFKFSEFLSRRWGAQAGYDESNKYTKRNITVIKLENRTLKRNCSGSSGINTSRNTSCSLLVQEVEVVEYYQEWIATAGLRVSGVNVSFSTSVVPSVLLQFEISDILSCSCEVSWTGCASRCQRSGLLLAASLSQDDILKFAYANHPQVISSNSIIEAAFSDLDISLPAMISSQRSPRGFSSALQTSAEKSRSLLSGNGLLSESISAPLQVKPLTAFSFFRITRYAPSYTNAIAEVDIEFAALFSLQGREPLTLSLPGFGGPYEGHSEPVLVEALKGSDGHLFGGAWYPGLSKLVLYLRCASLSIPPQRRFKIRLPSGLGVRLPLAGIDANNTAITISSPTTPTQVVDMSPGIGGFSDTEILFFPPSAAKKAKLVLTLTPHMDILTGSEIYVSLPGFRGENVESLVVKAGEYQVSWEGFRSTFETVLCHALHTYTTPARCANQSQNVNVENFAEFETVTEISIMSIRALRTYPAFVSTVFEIPQSVGIHVPVFGNSVNNKALKISCNTPNRPILELISIEVSPGILDVGRFSYFNMSFQHSNAPAMAGSVCNITIVFMAEMTFTAGDQIVFSLPSFSSQSATSPSFVSNVNVFNKTMFWNQEKQMLTVRVLKTFDGFSHCEMTVSGIRLPVEGVQLSQNSITISTQAASGPLDSQPVTYCPAVLRTGDLESAHLYFNSEGTTCDPMFGGFDSAFLCRRV